MRVAFIFPRLVDKSLAVLPAPQVAYATSRVRSLSVQFGIDFSAAAKTIRFGWISDKEVVYSAIAVASGCIFLVGQNFETAYCIAGANVVPSGLDRNYDFCVRKI